MVSKAFLNFKRKLELEIGLEIFAFDFFTMNLVLRNFLQKKLNTLNPKT